MSGSNNDDDCPPCLLSPYRWALHGRWSLGISCIHSTYYVIVLCTYLGQRDDTTSNGTSVVAASVGREMPRVWESPVVCTHWGVGKVQGRFRERTGKGPGKRPACGSDQSMWQPKINRLSAHAGDPHHMCIGSNEILDKQQRKYILCSSHEYYVRDFTTHFPSLTIAAYIVRAYIVHLIVSSGTECTDASRSWSRSQPSTAPMLRQQAVGLSDVS